MDGTRELMLVFGTGLALDWAFQYGRYMVTFRQSERMAERKWWGTWFESASSCLELSSHLAEVFTTVFISFTGHACLTSFYAFAV